MIHLFIFVNKQIQLLLLDVLTQLVSLVLYDSEYTRNDLHVSMRVLHLLQQIFVRALIMALQYFIRYTRTHTRTYY